MLIMIVNRSSVLWCFANYFGKDFAIKISGNIKSAVKFRDIKQHFNDIFNFNDKIMTKKKK